MADISFNDTQVKQQVNQVNPVQNAPQVHEISADINKTPVSAPAEKSSFENESLENVVATSEHGDTVQVFKNLIQILSRCDLGIEILSFA